jgi:hypothetical protein
MLFTKRPVAVKVGTSSLSTMLKVIKLQHILRNEQVLTYDRTLTGKLLTHMVNISKRVSKKSKSRLDSRAQHSLVTGVHITPV